MSTSLDTGVILLAGKVPLAKGWHSLSETCGPEAPMGKALACGTGSHWYRRADSGEGFVTVLLEVWKGVSKISIWGQDLSYIRVRELAS